MTWLRWQWFTWGNCTIGEWRKEEAQWEKEKERERGREDRDGNRRGVEKLQIANWTCPCPRVNLNWSQSREVQAAKNWLVFKVTGAEFFFSLPLTKKGWLLTPDSWLLTLNPVSLSLFLYCEQRAAKEVQEDAMKTTKRGNVPSFVALNGKPV